MRSISSSVTGREIVSEGAAATALSSPSLISGVSVVCSISVSSPQLIKSRLRHSNIAQRFVKCLLVEVLNLASGGGALIH